MPIDLSSSPVIQNSQLIDGSQLRTTTYADGSVYYDKLVNNTIAATTAFDPKGVNLFSTETQNNLPVYLTKDGIATGIAPLDGIFDNAVQTGQSSISAITSNNTLSLSPDS